MHNDDDGIAQEDVQQAHEMQEKEEEVEEPHEVGEEEVGHEEDVAQTVEEEEELVGQHVEEEEEEEGEDREEEEDEDGLDFEFFSDTEFNDNYKDILYSFSRKWLFTQLTHKVSGKATNEFWNLTMEYMPKLLEFKKREGRTKNIPRFIHLRRQLYTKFCPKVKMEFAFRKKIDGSIIKHTSSAAPLKAFQLNQEYEKLYEIASIKVRSHSVSFSNIFDNKFKKN